MMEDSNSIDPYKAPAANPEQGPDMESPGQGWRVEGGRLLLRDHARLPDVCLFGGQKGVPGRRIFLNFRRPGGRVRMVGFYTDQGKRRAAWRRSGVPTLFAAAFALVEWCVLLRWPSVPASVRLNACFVGLSFAALVAGWWAQRKDLRIVRSEGAWHELSGVDPVVVEELGRIAASVKDQAGAGAS